MNATENSPTHPIPVAQLSTAADLAAADAGRLAFYTVREAARVLRVNPATLYRAIREDAFPAVRIRSRYVIPAAAVEALAAQAAQSGGCVDVAQLAAQRRSARDAARISGGAPW